MFGESRQEKGLEITIVEKKKIGRPTDNPKSYRESFRLSEDDMEKIRFCIDNAGLSKTDVIRLGIKKVYQELKNEKGEV